MRQPDLVYLSSESQHYHVFCRGCGSKIRIKSAPLRGISSPELVINICPNCNARDHWARHKLNQITKIRSSIKEKIV